MPRRLHRVAFLCFDPAQWFPGSSVEERLTRIAHTEPCVLCLVVIRRVSRAMLSGVVFTILTDNCEIIASSFSPHSGDWRWLLCVVG